MIKVYKPFDYKKNSILDQPKAMSQSLLFTRKIYKRYGDFTALSDINFRLQPGTVHTLVGANGAGKSTFVKLLYGELQPSSGKIFIGGHHRVIGSPHRALDYGIAMVSQDFGLCENLSIAANLSFRSPQARGKFWYRKRAAGSAARSMLEEMEIGLDPGLPVAALSVADKQRVAICRAMQLKPRILILDEPTSVLSAAQFAQLSGHIRRFTAGGGGVIYITHKMPEVKALSDELSILRDGEIIAAYNRKSIDEMDITGYFGNIRTASKRARQKKIHHLLPDAQNRVDLHIPPGHMACLTASGEYDVQELVRHFFGAGPYPGLSLQVNGYPPVGNPAASLRRKIALISDDRYNNGIIHCSPVGDNIMLAAFRVFSRFALLRSGAIKQECRQLLNQLLIKHRSLAQDIGELSGGNQQKVLIARSILVDFELLLLIEPLAGIDIKGKQDILDIMKALKKKGKSFLVVTSAPEEIAEACDENYSL
jgi:ABC-type sugar transport system ATPase subunit